MHHTLQKIICLICLLTLLCSTASAAVIPDDTLSVYPRQQPDGTWTANAPRPFIEREMGSGLLEIWFGHVGVYDCFIIRCNGEVMMIDGGTYSRIYGTMEFLENLGIKRLDYMFNTHWHDDHLEAQATLMRRGFPVGKFLSPYERGFRQAEQQYAEQIIDQAGIPFCTVHHGDTLMLGGENGAQITFYQWQGNADPNLSSMMCRIVYGNRSAYFMADVSVPAQTDLGRNYLDVIPWDSDIFKVGHHGFNRQDDRLLQAISPELCVITNSIVAAEECITQLKRLHLDWCITAKGTIYLRTDGGEDWLLAQDNTPRK